MTANSRMTGAKSFLCVCRPSMHVQACIATSQQTLHRGSYVIRGISVLRQSVLSHWSQANDFSPGTSHACEDPILLSIASLSHVSCLCSYLLCRHELEAA